MPFKDGEMHVVAALGAAALSAALALPTLVLTRPAEADEGPKLDKMVAIEASIARKTSPQKQPQKQFRPPEPVKPPEGVSHDEHKLPDPKKPDKPPPRPPDDKAPKNTPPPDRRGGLDDPPGPVTAPTGPPSDNARGFADVTKGDPYFQRIARDVHESFEFPKILAAESSANGCMYFNPDGKVAGWKLLPKSGDDALDDAVERALKKVQKLRESNPDPVPTYLLQQATTTWTCFKLGEQKREE